MYSSYEYNPPASYYEPPEPPSWSREEIRVLDDAFLLILTFDNNIEVEEIVSESDIRETYKYIDEHKEDGLTKMEVYEMAQEFGIYYGKCEDDYYEEEIGEEYSGDLLYSEEF